MKAYKLRGKLALIAEDFKGKLIVAGDLHGDFEAFRRIKDLFLRERDSLLIFLGDYADRGSQGLELVEGVWELMVKFGERVIALKGNHEDYREGVPRFSPCDLPWEVEEKKGVRWADFFPRFEREFLNKMHLAVLVPKLALLVHGGVSSKIEGLGDLENPSVDIEEDISWSDPYGGEGELPNPRGAGVLFGPEVSEALTKRIGVKYIVRSHEPAKALEGTSIEHGGRIFTLSSTRVYGGKAFVLAFRSDPELTLEDLRAGASDLFELRTTE